LKTRGGLLIIEFGGKIAKKKTSSQKLGGKIQNIGAGQH
jgi:hypothetical protein